MKEIEILELEARKKKAQATILFVAYGSILSSVLAAALVIFGVGALVTFVYNFSFGDLLGYDKMSLWNGTALTTLGTFLFLIVKRVLSKLGV